MADRRKLRITKSFTFDSAHKLNDYNGKCSNLHGHTYQLDVSVSGIPDGNGMVMDFHDLERIVIEKAISTIDHAYLNEKFSFNPTCENIALWLWEIIGAGIDEVNSENVKNSESGKNLKQLDRIVLWETRSSCVTVER